MVARTKKVHFVWRVEEACDEAPEGPFQVAEGFCHLPLYRTTPHRPGPNRVHELEAHLYRAKEPRFGAYSLPNLRHWFPRSAVRYLQRQSPDAFHVALYRARDVLIAGRQAAFDLVDAERVATFPLSDLHTGDLP